eukprot:4659023-Heterocapsa_arctica.AAC.1
MPDQSSRQSSALRLLAMSEVRRSQSSVDALTKATRIAPCGPMGMRRPAEPGTAGEGHEVQAAQPEVGALQAVLPD